MGIGADQRVRSGDTVLDDDPLGKVLHIDLVADADARRNDLERLEGLHAPFHQGVALAVARELDLHIAAHRVGTAGDVGLDGMIDDKVNGNQRLDAPRIVATRLGLAAHGGEVGQQRNSGEVLEQHPGNGKRNLLVPDAIGRPASQGVDVAAQDLCLVAMAQRRFQEQPDDIGQPRDVDALVLGKGRQRENRQGAAIAQIERSSDELGKRVICGHVITRKDRPT